MAESARKSVELVYALPDRQWLVELEVDESATVREIVCSSNVANEFPQLDVQTSPLGIYSREVADTFIPAAGDRIEIYRPLEMNPREARRQLAARGLTMGGGRLKRD